MVNIRSEEDLKIEELGYSEEQMAEVEVMGADPYIYQKMAKSICPNVWGSEDIKKAILLMLIGGVHKRTHEVGDMYMWLVLCLQTNLVQQMYSEFNTTGVQNISLIHKPLIQCWYKSCEFYFIS